MNTGERTGLTVSALGLIFSCYSWKMARATIGNPIEPLIFPLLLGAILLLCGIILFVSENRKKSTNESSKQTKSSASSHEVKMIIIICVTSILYGVLLEKIGYVVSTTLFLSIILFAFNGKKQWLVNLIVAILFSVSVYYLFSQTLGIPLPQVPFLRI